jgi:hypothetical protein
MRRQTLKTTLTIFAPCTIALSMTLAARKLAGQNAGGQVSMQAYNPYPPGILPSDLNPEIERVRRELRMLEQRALERWHDLKPPLVRGQPPTLQNTGTEAIETLGELMNYDQKISPNKNEACSFCHMPYAGFSGPIPSATQASPTTTKAACVRITQGPEIERADTDFAIIRWTSNNPGGSPEHYGVVHYGTDPKKLSQTANSPIRLNPGHSYTVFRARMDSLKPRTTYYYTLDSMEANGAATA